LKIKKKELEKCSHSDSSENWLHLYLLNYYFIILVFLLLKSVNL
jgi:hypothetical protein